MPSRLPVPSVSKNGLPGTDGMVVALVGDEEDQPADEGEAGQGDDERGQPQAGNDQSLDHPDQHTRGDRHQDGGRANRTSTCRPTG